MKRLFVLALIVAAICLPFWRPATVYAGTGEIVFVETQVDLSRDGSAVVAYTVQWRVVSGVLHGFYFQGNDQLRIDTMSSDSYAVDSQGNRYGLSISQVLCRYAGHSPGR